MAWQKNGTPDTLGSAADALSISDMIAKKFNQSLVHVIKSGQTTRNIQFNNNSNSVYANRISTNGAADGTTTSDTDMEIVGAYTSGDGDFSVDYICSISGEEKLGILLFIYSSGGTGAGVAPDRREVVYKFVPSPDADITQIDYDNGGTGDFDTNSNLSALGTD